MKIFKLIVLKMFCIVLVQAQTKQPKIKVYLLGTFHFAQTDSTYDVLETKHQQSIAKLCKIVEKQNPDKIFIERMPDFEYVNRMDSLFRAFKNVDTVVRRNEIWQVAFKVAKALNHQTIYSCDHPGQFGYYYSQLENYASQHNQQSLLKGIGKGITIPQSDLIDEDSLRNNISLLAYMRWLNSKQVQTSAHAHYINLYPQMGNTNVFVYDSTYFLGAELTADWYRRNIKIYSKIIAQLNYSEHAIFLIMGNDHIPIIRHLFEGNPFFKVMDTEMWLGKSELK